MEAEIFEPIPMRLGLNIRYMLPITFQLPNQIKEIKKKFKTLAETSK